MSTQVVVGYRSRVATISAGLAHHAPAMTLNRLCGSGGQGIAAVVGEHSGSA